jgi:hypothetical protein
VFASMAASAVAARGWRQSLAKFVDSILFSVCILLLIVLDITIGLYFDETFNPIASNIDCYGREHLVAAITTAFVLWVFCQEVTAQILIQGHLFFIPFTLGKLPNYLDIVIVVISVGVSAYKVSHICALANEGKNEIEQALAETRESPQP